MSESEKLSTEVWVPSFRTNGRRPRESRGDSRGYREGPARSERQSLSEVKLFSNTHI